MCISKVMNLLYSWNSTNTQHYSLYSFHGFLQNMNNARKKIFEITEKKGWDEIYEMRWKTIWMKMWKIRWIIHGVAYLFHELNFKCCLSVVTYNHHYNETHHILYLVCLCQCLDVRLQFWLCCKCIWYFGCCC